MLLSKTMRALALGLLTVSCVYSSEQQQLPKSIQEMKYDEENPQFQAASTFRVGLSRVAQGMRIGGYYAVYVLGGLVYLAPKVLDSLDAKTMSKVYNASAQGLNKIGLKTDGSSQDVTIKTAGVGAVATIGVGVTVGTLYGLYRARSYYKARRKNNGKNIFGACATKGPEGAEGVNAWLKDDPTLVLSQDDQNRTLLMYSAANGACQAADVVLDKAPQTIDCQDAIDKRTALGVAAHCEQDQMVRKLLARKANASLKDRNNNQKMSEANAEMLFNAIQAQAMEEQREDRDAVVEAKERAKQQAKQPQETETEMRQRLNIEC